MLPAPKPNELRKEFREKKQREEAAVLSGARGRIKTKWVVRGEVFYSKREAAEHFGVHVNTIRSWCRTEPECWCERLVNKQWIRE